VNENLVNEPNLLKEKSNTDGYVAIIQPKLPKKKKRDSLSSCSTSHLLDSKEYHKIRIN